MSAIPHSPEPKQGAGSPGAPGAGQDAGGRRPSPPPAQEFRRYRRFVTLVALAIIFVGSAYLLVSVGVTIYRQRSASAPGTPLLAPLSQQELVSCWQGLTDATESLAKHLEKSHYLLGGYDQAEAQRWAGEGEYWRRQWRALGVRCHLDRAAATEGPKALEEMVGAYRDLGETYAVYTKDLLSFSREQAPRLDRVRKRITRIGKRLESPGAP